MNLAVTNFEPKRFVLYGWCKQEICLNVTEEMWKAVTLIFHLPYQNCIAVSGYLAQGSESLTACLK